MDDNRFTMNFVMNPIKVRHCSECGKVLFGLSICIGRYVGGSKWPVKFNWMHINHTPKHDRRWIVSRVRRDLKQRAKKRMGLT